MNATSWIVFELYFVLRTMQHNEIVSNESGKIYFVFVSGQRLNVALWQGHTVSAQESVAVGCTPAFRLLSRVHGGQGSAAIMLQFFNPH
jgi:hypothetical protein